MSNANFIQFQGITKTFGGVTALRDVSLDIARGECHGLMGENGAGKSTLGKVLAGIHRPDSGTLTIDGQAHAFGSPRDAMAAGVAMVHQELAFCPNLSVAENLSMGRYPRKYGVVLDRKQMAAPRPHDARQASARPSAWNSRCATLSTAQEQLVQIAAVVGANPRIIVFDEPTSSLAEPEAQNLFLLIEEPQAARHHDRLRLAPPARTLPALRPHQRPARRGVRRHRRQGKDDPGRRRAHDDRPQRGGVFSHAPRGRRPGRWS